MIIKNSEKQSHFVKEDVIIGKLIEFLVEPRASESELHSENDQSNTSNKRKRICNHTAESTRPSKCSSKKRTISNASPTSNKEPSKSATNMSKNSHDTIHKTFSYGNKILKAKDKMEDTINPSDFELNKAIYEILREVDFSTVTVTDIMLLLVKSFDTDLISRKASIKLMIEDELIKLDDTEKTEGYVDFVMCIHTDLCLHIMSFIDNSADLIHVNSVSRAWRQFVVKNGLARKLCLRSFPQISKITHIYVDGTTFCLENCMDWKFLLKQQQVYASLHALCKSKISPRVCIHSAVSASSTFFVWYVPRSVTRTLDPGVHSLLYWSSTGQENPEEPETLIYKMKSGLWVISEINIQPFQDCSVAGERVYSSKCVRFRFGELVDLSNESKALLDSEKHDDDMFLWTYTSPEYPMKKNNLLQRFVLPKPHLIEGGYMQIELIGRVKRKMDGLFYIWLVTQPYPNSLFVYEKIA